MSSNREMCEPSIKSIRAGLQLMQETYREQIEKEI
jgi:hypothetical protein